MLAEVLDELFEEDVAELLIALETELKLEMEVAELDDVATDELTTELGAIDDGGGVELPPPPPPQAMTVQLRKGISRCFSVFMVSL